MDLLFSKAFPKSSIPRTKRNRDKKRSLKNTALKIKERGSVADVSYTATQLDTSFQNILIQFRIPASKLKK